MAKDNEHPDELSDNQLEQLLKTGLDVAKPTTEFSAKLLSRLDHEFRLRAQPDEVQVAKTRFAETSTLDFTTVDPDAVAINTSAGGQPSATDGVLPFSALTSGKAKSRRSKLRVIGAISTAAALLIALGLGPAVLLTVGLR